MQGKCFDFTIQGLKKRLTDLLAQGYEFKSDFSETDSLQIVYLRHDVDLCLELARKIAVVESEMGISATFFLQVGSEFYNLFSKESSSIIEELMNLGHEVGLHFDARVDPNPNSMSATLAQEIDVLEQICRRKILFYSQHKPTELGWQNLSHPYAKDVREQTATRNIEYFSDSTGYFRWGDYRNTANNWGSFQLLLHPIWWSSDVPRHPRATLEEFLETYQGILHRKVAETVSKFASPDGSTFGWPKELSREEL